MVPAALSQSQLCALLAALEVPECDCLPAWGKTCGCEGWCDCEEEPLPVRCEHVLTADQYFPPELTVAEWATLLLLAMPGDYASRPSPPCRSIAMSRQARVEIYAEREASGFAIWHQDDLWRYDDAHPLKVGVISKRGEDAARLRNGRPNPHETLADEALARGA